VIGLSPLLNTGLIIKYFNQSGKTSEERDLLQIYVKGEMKRALVFKILIGISS
jgi:hypothetical protein